MLYRLVRNARAHNYTTLPGLRFNPGTLLRPSVHTLGKKKPQLGTAMLLISVLPNLHPGGKRGAFPTADEARWHTFRTFEERDQHINVKHLAAMLWVVA